MGGGGVRTGGRQGLTHRRQQSQMGGGGVRLKGAGTNGKVRGQV